MKTFSLLLFSFSCTLLICVGFTSSLSLDGNEITRSRIGRVINGFEAQLGQFPYTVSLRVNTGNSIQSQCTASLISDQSVLTAAHCVVSGTTRQVYPPEYFDGILGSVQQSDTRNRVTFKEFRVHGRYSGRYSMFTVANDIAILILKKPVEMSEYIKTIALPEKGMRFDGKDVTAVGWGKYRFGREYGPSFLRFMETRVAISDRICSSRSMYFDHNSNICIEQKNRVCVFKGDSGGPLVKTGYEIDVAIGVASYVFSAYTCSKLPAVYMSTSAYYDWINKNAVGKITYVSSLHM